MLHIWLLEFSLRKKVKFSPKVSALSPLKVVKKLEKLTNESGLSQSVTELNKSAYFWLFIYLFLIQYFGC